MLGMPCLSMNACFEGKGEREGGLLHFKCGSYMVIIIVCCCSIWFAPAFNEANKFSGVWGNRSLSSWDVSSALDFESGRGVPPFHLEGGGEREEEREKERACRAQ